MLYYHNQFYSYLNKKAEYSYFGLNYKVMSYFFGFKHAT